jgi:hypothetical protein
MKIAFPVIIKMKVTKKDPVIELTANSVEEYDSIRSQHRDIYSLISMVDAAGIDHAFLQVMIPDYVRSICEKRIAKNDSKCSTCVQKYNLMKPQQVADIDVIYACVKEYDSLTAEERSKLIA